ncbi:hypothetical protein M426DRAFT_320378 [Hypoxylon sp. CI-4A]|nr:hypothetical protein M426DRAFT_320378 [Hypoxylon sp. CI-4A]
MTLQLPVRRSRFRLVAKRPVPRPFSLYSQLPIGRVGSKLLPYQRNSPAFTSRFEFTHRCVHQDTTDMSSSDPSHSIPSPSVKPTASAEQHDSGIHQQKQERELPPLKGAEFRAYNRLAEHMDVFHSHFRTSWNVLWTAACSGTSNKKPSRGGRSIINDGLAFVSQLEMHHSIEETYIFPVLARRMPEFRSDGKGGKNAAELLRQHGEIHTGMEGMGKYLRSCRDGEKELNMNTLKDQMQSWGAVLWKHLDQEVETLGAENMRKYWTAEEIRRIPM